MKTFGNILTRSRRATRTRSRQATLSAGIAAGCAAALQLWHACASNRVSIGVVAAVMVISLPISFWVARVVYLALSEPRQPNQID